MKKLKNKINFQVAIAKLIYLCYNIISGKELAEIDVRFLKKR